ncbi:hypothetical protein FEM03_20845 [Phragmitibacter flavus]|uniref:Uncharacterized protein n=1 Tax=Phragmitibacter flavus TaxID=2576071 RepID=A0A5R8K8X4_9BACT|nr:hypothetical protein [Phragmitibacter flavus]TLD68784.1 hypothetical protein FEM03_20845 [Phragmitibacter flavus]
MRTYYIILLVALTLLTQCSETHSDILERHREPFSQFVKELESYAQNLPLENVIPSAPLNPSPSSSRSGPVIPCNTATFLVGQLTDPNPSPHRDSTFNLFMNNGFDTLYNDLQKSPAEHPVTPEPFLEQNYQRTLNVRYIGIIKPFKHKAPKLLAENQFEAGYAAGRFWLIDRNTRQIVYSDAFIARNNSTVLSQDHEYLPKEINNQGKLEVDLKHQTGKLIAEKFAEATGGTFTYQ